MDASQPTKRVYTVKPNKECKQCYGSGEVNDWVDYGSTRVSMPSICECVYDTLCNQHDVPDDDQDYDIELDLSDYDPTYRLPVSVEP